jgi:hypothetical protein
MRRTIVAAAAVTATALLLGACGGNDPAVSEKGAVATTATTAATTGDTGGGGGGGSLTAIFGSAECQRAALTMSQAMTATVSGSGTAANFDEAGKTLRAAAEAAPREIKADMGTLADAFAGLYDRLGKVAYDPKAGQVPPKEYLSAFEVFNDTKYQEASKNVSAWFGSNCGIKN